MGGDIGWAPQTMLMVALSIDDVVLQLRRSNCGFCVLHNTMQNDAPKTTMAVVAPLAVHVQM